MPRTLDDRCGYTLIGMPIRSELSLPVLWCPVSGDNCPVDDIMRDVDALATGGDGLEGLDPGRWVATSSELRALVRLSSMS